MLNKIHRQPTELESAMLLAYRIEIGAYPTVDWEQVTDYTHRKIHQPNKRTRIPLWFSASAFNKIACVPRTRSAD